MSNWRQRIFSISPARIAVAVGVATIFLHWLNTAVSGRLDHLPVLGRIESILYDLKFQERDALGLTPKPSGKVVIGAIDEKAIDTVGRYPWSRADVGRIIDRLVALDARVIAFDMAFTDQVTSGAEGAAQRLASRFQEVSLANGEASQALERLANAQTAAAGALEAARSLGSKAPAARDVEARLEPVTGAVSDALAVLGRYRQLQAGYGEQLALEGAGKSPEEQLADAVHRSGRVVLGTFTLTQAELDQLKPGEAERAYKLMQSVTLPASATIEEASGRLRDERDPAGLSSLLRFPGVRAPLDMLVLAPPATEGRPSRPNPVGLFTATPDPDGVIRREPLAVAVGALEAPLVLPTLPLASLLELQDADPNETRLWTQQEGRFSAVGILPKSRTSDEPATYEEFLSFPVDSRGHLILNYYGPARAFDTVSLGDVWSGALPRERVAGKVVFIGATATGTMDQRVTPYSDMDPGVITHATAADNMISGETLQRPNWFLLMEWLLILTVAIGLGRTLERATVMAGLPLTLLAMSMWHVVDLGLFCSGYVTASFLPLAQMASTYLFQTIYRYNTEEKEKRQIRRAFQFYLTKSVMEEMLQDPSKLKLGGDKRVLTVLFSDIRGFTTISERLTPEQLAKLINEYLTPMTNIVFEHGGTLDKYIGDALMAIWGAPVQQDDHALRCCKAAMGMMRELKVLQERWRMEGRDYPPIDVGIGINSGPMVVGNMGADQRFDYTVLGDNVNLASRLEGTNKDYQSHVIISESTYLLCKEHVAARELGAVRVKGKREPVRIYELMDDKPASGELAEVIALFNEGVRAFREQRWEDGRRKFREVLEIEPADGPCHAYLGFCDDYEKDPPGEGWDGVYTMTHK